MKVYECDRCGKAIHVQKSKDIEQIKCSHCNKEFTVDKVTRRWAFFILGILVIILSFVVSAITQLFKIPMLLALLPTIVLAFFMYRWSLWILGKMNKLQYVGTSSKL